MPSFERCDKAYPKIIDISQDLLQEFHQPLIEAGVKITFMMAWPCLDENGDPIEDALTKGGMKCLGLCRKNALRHRKEGLADATITLDGPYFDEAEEPELRSLIDHEMEHISVVPDGENSDGKTIYKRDNAGRPIIKLRKHDVEVGWFKACAERHGAHSQERIQATQILVEHGQLLFPQLIVEKASRVQSLEVSRV